MYANKLEYEKMKQVYEATKIAFNLVNKVSVTAIIVNHDIKGEINRIKTYLNTSLKFTETLLNTYRENL
ncbi:hypothetical protein CDLVIII_1458 [Clostridium sp. DL-VIII]|uniref:hypothetical protein n=1 Tax=Clostridium sp. DL-VIII TaxID=641107 RepID=UPI00023AF09B|nr:hypothetical protein [Clostridium sp. DL-VIII]EHI98151.1 hypothetical protein CDLVIII_1458 [Clostridium sp. DL-VIII]